MDPIDAACLGLGRRGQRLECGSSCQPSGNLSPTESPLHRTPYYEVSTATAPDEAGGNAAPRAPTPAGPSSSQSTAQAERGSRPEPPASHGTPAATEEPPARATREPPNARATQSPHGLRITRTSIGVGLLHDSQIQERGTLPLALLLLSPRRADQSIPVPTDLIAT